MSSMTTSTNNTNTPPPTTTTTPNGITDSTTTTTAHTHLTWDLVRDALTNSLGPDGILQLSGDKWYLTSLDGLSTSAKDFAARVSEVQAINLQGNNITSLAELRVLRHSVRRIDAQRNQLKYLCPTLKDPTRNAWPAKFEKLVELNLSFNSLRNIPNLEAMPALKRLLLRHNDIVPPLDGLRMGKNLQELDLAQNRLGYDSMQAFEKDSSVFSHLEHLERLSLELNPVVRDAPEYRITVLRALLGNGAHKRGKIQIIDGTRITEAMCIRAARAPSPDIPTTTTTTTQPNNAWMVIEPTPTTSSSSRPIELTTDHQPAPPPPPSLFTANDAMEINQTLQRLCVEMDEIRFDPSKTVQVFDRVIQTIQRDLVSKPIRAFVSESDVSSFVEKLSHLAATRPDIVSSVLRVLTMLAGTTHLLASSTTHQGSIGEACWIELENLLQENEAQRVKVEEAFNNYMFANLSKDDTLLMLRLVRMVERTRLPEMLRNLAPKLAIWLIESQPPAPSVLFLAQAAAQHGDSAKILASEGVAETIAMELSHINVVTAAAASTGVNQIIAALGLATLLCEQTHVPLPVSGQDAPPVSTPAISCASYFVSKNIHTNIVLRTLASTVDKSQQVLTQQQQNQTWAEVKTELISSYIDFLAAVTKDRNGVMDLLGSSGNKDKLFNILTKIVSGSGKPKTLTSVFKLLTTLLQTPKSWFPIIARESGKPSTMTSNIDDGIPQPPYSMTLDTLYNEISHGILRGVQETVLEVINERSDAYTDNCKAACDSASPVRLSSLTNQTMQDLLEAATNLIAVYCAEAAVTPTPIPKAKEIAEILNKKNREKNLFGLLAVPSDRVNLAAINCLFVVPLDQLDAGEVSHLVSMLRKVKDVTKGRVEEVVAKSLEILTKLCLSDELGERFRQDHGKNAVEATFSILEKNVSRDTSKSKTERDEQSTLTASCLRFLRTCSAFNLSVLLTSPSPDHLNRILVIENQFATNVRANPRPEFQERSRANHSPVCLESISTGRLVSVLLQILLSVSPQGPVAPRLVRRIADVLSGMKDPTPAELKVMYEKAGSKDDVGKVVAKQVEMERTCSSFFVDPFTIIPPFIPPFQSTESQQQHHLFADIQGIQRLLTFVGEAVGEAEDLRGTNWVKARFDWESVARMEAVAGEPSPSLPLNGNGITAAQGDLATALTYSLQIEAAATSSEFANTPITHVSTSAYSGVLSGVHDAEAHLAQQTSATGEWQKDLELTELVAATCRVLFTCLTFGPRQSKQATINTLRNKAMFRIMTEMCMGTKTVPHYVKSHLGTKYFCLARAILEMEGVQRVETNPDVPFLYATVFHCAQHVFNFLSIRLAIHGRLFMGDDSLVFSVATCLIVLMEQLSKVQRDSGWKERAMSVFVTTELVDCALRFFVHTDRVLLGKSAWELRFKELTRDRAREALKEFLALCVLHCPTQRHHVLEHLVRSQVVDQFPVRPILVKELLGRVEENDELPAYETVIHGLQSDAWIMSVLSTTSSPNTGVVATSSSLPVGLSWFAWCVGAGRKDGSISTQSHSNDASMNVVAALGKWNAYPADLSSNFSWAGGRTIGKERILFHAHIQWFSQHDIPILRPGASRLLLVLTSDAMYLFDCKTVQASVVMNGLEKLWVPTEEGVKLVWKRPYRAVQRLGLSSSRVYLRLALYDENQGPVDDDIRVATVVMVMSTRQHAKKAAMTLARMCDVWFEADSYFKFISRTQPVRLEMLNLNEGIAPLMATSSRSPFPLGDLFLRAMVTTACQSDAPNSSIPRGLEPVPGSMLCDVVMVVIYQGSVVFSGKNGATALAILTDGKLVLMDGLDWKYWTFPALPPLREVEEEKGVQQPSFRDSSMRRGGAGRDDEGEKIKAQIASLGDAVARFMGIGSMSSTKFVFRIKDLSQVEFYDAEGSDLVAPAIKLTFVGASTYGKYSAPSPSSSSALPLQSPLPPPSLESTSLLVGFQDDVSREVWRRALMSAVGLRNVGIGGGGGGAAA